MTALSCLKRTMRTVKKSKNKIATQFSATAGRMRCQFLSSSNYNTSGVMVYWVQEKKKNLYMGDGLLQNFSLNRPEHKAVGLTTMMAAWLVRLLCFQRRPKPWLSFCPVHCSEFLLVFRRQVEGSIYCLQHTGICHQDCEWGCIGCFYHSENSWYKQLSWHVYPHQLETAAKLQRTWQLTLCRAFCASLSQRSGFAPCFSSNFTTDVWPQYAALWSGVVPDRVAAFTLAPFRSNRLQISSCPFLAA